MPNETHNGILAINEGYEDVLTLDDDGGGYEWQEMHVYKKDGRFFADSQSGCSCYTWEEPNGCDLVEITSLEGARNFWSDAISWDNTAEHWDRVRPLLIELGLR